MNELRDFYDRYMAAFNGRDQVSFERFFHLPVTVFPLVADGRRPSTHPPTVVTVAADLWPVLPARWTRSTVDHLGIVGDASAFTPRPTLEEPFPRRAVLQATVTRWAGDDPYQQVHVLYVLAVHDGRLGIAAMIPLAVADSPERTAPERTAPA